jgi:hypothetical protein
MNVKGRVSMFGSDQGNHAVRNRSCPRPQTIGFDNVRATCQAQYYNLNRGMGVPDAWNRCSMKVMWLYRSR